MFVRRLFAVSGLVFASLISAQAPVSVPDTPAGNALAAWLGAYNSGDRAQIEAFIKTRAPHGNADHEMYMRQRTGGFDLIAIDLSEKNRIAFRVRERASPGEALGKFDVSPGDPAQIGNFTLRAVPAGTKFEDFKLDAATRARVVDAAARLLDEYYVFADVAKKMGADLRARLKRGEYDAIVDGDAFADRLVTDLRAISHDRHLGVDFHAAAPTDSAAGHKADGGMHGRRQAGAMNCGFEKAEHLEHNIGYLKFDMFIDPDACAATAIAAMNFLADSDAIIFDLRENGGGEPRMIALISTYLFDEPTHLNDLYNRKEGTTDQYWTLPYVPGKRLPTAPVFVLTSPRTLSAPEGFTFALQKLKRATIIGETTGGGAHPVSGHRIDDHFAINVPFARAINPITKTNWEGAGVEPDIKVPAGEALERARKLAEEKLRGDRAPG